MFTLSIPALTIPDDDTLADDNAAAEQREEWADYGEMETTFRSTCESWNDPRAKAMMRQHGWHRLETSAPGLWFLRYPLLSADYA
jgi:hypothetical protein